MEAPTCCSECPHWQNATKRMSWGYDSELRFCEKTKLYKFSENASCGNWREES